MESTLAENNINNKEQLKNNKGIARDIDFNDDFARAFSCLEDSKNNCFITGKPGVGKSTFLECFRERTRKRVVAVAPTGVAALNIKAQTVHSLFSFPPSITRDKVKDIILKRNKELLFKNLDALIIDEVSMIRADLLDCIDVFLRIHGHDPDQPFGGIQVIFFGDLFQLPPVVTKEEGRALKRVYPGPYFFDSDIFNQMTIEVVEFKRNYRQKDPNFLKVLDRIRRNEASCEDLQIINDRFDPGFQPRDDDFYVYVTTTNAMADNINTERLSRLNTKTYYFEGDLCGGFSYENLPAERCLELKVGAQVMFANNDFQGRWVNGTIGHIIDMSGGGSEAFIEIKLSTGEIVHVDRFTWKMYRQFYNEEKKALDSEEVGSFTQYPLKLAWAVTIHKSQGKTLPKVIVDIGRGTFCHGQLYVALSRCTCLEGLVLKRKIYPLHIIVDGRIVEFMNRYENKLVQA